MNKYTFIMNNFISLIICYFLPIISSLLPTKIISTPSKAIDTNLRWSNIVKNIPFSFLRKNTLYSSFKPMDHDKYLQFNNLFNNNSDNSDNIENNNIVFNNSCSTNYTVNSVSLQKQTFKNDITYLINNSKNIPGLYVGIPLVILTSFFTYHHYGYNIMNFKIILVEFLLGIYTYGNDKLYDALQYKNQPFNTTNENLYKNLIKNEYVFKELFKTIYYIITVSLFDLNANIFDSIACIILYDITKWFIKFREFVKTPYIATGSILLIGMNELHILQYLPFVLLIDYTNNYIELKKKCGLLKPFYVSLMWAISTVVLPSVMYENNFSILNSPLDILSPFSIIFALSNYVDIKDIKEDTINGIDTIPVKYGERTALAISIFFMVVYIFVTIK